MVHVFCTESAPIQSVSVLKATNTHVDLIKFLLFTTLKFYPDAGNLLKPGLSGIYPIIILVFFIGPHHLVEYIEMF